VKALEKIVVDTDWITILLLLILCGVFFLKGLDAKKLNRYAFTPFDKSIIEKEIENNTSFFKLFNYVMFLFSILVLSLLVTYFASNFLKNTPKEVNLFGASFLLIFSYFSIKWILEYLLSLLFLAKKEVAFFLVSKSFYLYNICFYLFVVLILTEYTSLGFGFLTVLTVLLFTIRFLVHLYSNKNLIFNKLFYYFLYLCALEIAPLFILFKWVV
jgi:hypothetical protein